MFYRKSSHYLQWNLFINKQGSLIACYSLKRRDKTKGEFSANINNKANKSRAELLAKETPCDAGNINPVCSTMSSVTKTTGKIKLAPSVPSLIKCNHGNGFEQLFRFKFNLFGFISSHFTIRIDKMIMLNQRCGCHHKRRAWGWWHPVMLHKYRKINMIIMIIIIIIHAIVIILIIILIK